MDPNEIRRLMVELEETPDRERTVAQAAAEILRVADDEKFEELLSNEVWRTTVLCRTHYTPRVAVLPNEQVIAAALVQGITLAVAVLQDKGVLPAKS